MKRDFSERAKQDLINKLAESSAPFFHVNNYNTNTLTQPANELGISSVSKYVENSCEYTHEIGVATNQAQKEIEGIFAEVKGVDSDFLESFKGFAAAMDSYTNLVNTLISAIRPQNGRVVTAESIKNACADASKKLDSAMDNVDDIYNSQAAIAYKDMFKKAAKDFFINTIKFAIAVAGFLLAPQTMGLSLFLSAWGIY